MKVSEAIRQRRAVKAFDPTHRIREDEVEALMQLVKLSPTAFNIQNWRFVLAQDPVLRQQLRDAAWGQAQVTDASLLVVVTADLPVAYRELLPQLRPPRRLKHAAYSPSALVWHVGVRRPPGTRIWTPSRTSAMGDLGDQRGARARGRVAGSALPGSGAQRVLGVDGTDPAGDRPSPVVPAGLCQ